MSSSPLDKRGIGELQRSLERFETYNDGFILPDTRLVIRLDAHRIGDWARIASGEYPCGIELTKAFHSTAKALLTSSFRVVLAYAHGDEISLYIDPTENSNPLRRSKLISSFASAAALHFRDASGLSALFDARLSELPSDERLTEYFMWQRRYCFRNAITIALRRTLADAGLSADDVERRLHGLPEAQRIDALAQAGVSLQSIPSTTRHGAVFSWHEVEKDGRSTFSIRETTSLPLEDEDFLNLIKQLLRKGSGVSTANIITHDKKSTLLKSEDKGNSAHSPQRPFRPTKRSNVSVVKLAQNSDRPAPQTPSRARR